VDYEVTTDASLSPLVRLVYLSERDIEPDALGLLTVNVRKRFENPDARVIFERIEVSSAPLSFGRNQAQIRARDAELLDRLGQQLKRFGSLRAEVFAGAEKSERDGVTEERRRAVVNYLSQRWQVAPDRIDLKPGPLERPEALLTFSIGESKAPE
jgi:hypothetical protein